jgi:gas vesicle protein
MENYEDEHDDHSGSAAMGFVAGMLIGGLASAGAMLLMAPQSGRRTRVQIRRKSMELRDQAMDSMEDAVEQVRTTSQQITANVQKQGDKLQKQADKIQQRGLHAIDEQKERWAPVVEAGQKAVNGG